MRAILRSILATVGICLFAATGAFAFEPILLGTTGACNNLSPGGPCTQTSTLVQLDPQSGALIRTIGEVGFTVNGLAWDAAGRKLYASTAIGDVRFHGLITIDRGTGAGTPVNPAAPNFGLSLNADGTESPIHSITIDPFGFAYGWYDEFGPGATDTFVQINKRTGVATEFPNTGIDSNSNGLAFQAIFLWNIDAPKRQLDGTVTQTAFLINPLNGKSLLARPLSPPTQAALGDFHPTNLLYYGLDFIPFSNGKTNLVTVDTFSGKVATVGPALDHL